jgi:hypothetical protein
MNVVSPLSILEIKGPEHPHYPALVLILIALFALSVIYYKRSAAASEPFLTCIKPAPFGGPFVTSIPLFKSANNKVAITVFHSTKVCNSKRCKFDADAIASSLNGDARMAPAKASGQYTITTQALDAVLSKNNPTKDLVDRPCFPYVQYIITIKEPSHQKAVINKYTLATDKEGILRDIKAGVEAVKNLWSL